MSEHGYGRYTNGCRCEVCRAAKAAYMRKRRAFGRALAQQWTATSTGQRGNRSNAWAPGSKRYVAPIGTHGTRAGYDEHGCRCEPCTTHASSTWKGGRSQRRTAVLAQQAGP
jgi:hypothetical protein